MRRPRCWTLCLRLGESPHITMRNVQKAKARNKSDGLGNRTWKRAATVGTRYESSSSFLAPRSLAVNGRRVACLTNCVCRRSLSLVFSLTAVVIAAEFPEVIVCRLGTAKVGADAARDTSVCANRHDEVCAGRSEATPLSSKK